MIRGKDSHYALNKRKKEKKAVVSGGGTDHKQQGNVKMTEEGDEINVVKRKIQKGEQFTMFWLQTEK